MKKIITTYLLLVLLSSSIPMQSVQAYNLHAINATLVSITETLSAVSTTLYQLMKERLSIENDAIVIEQYQDESFNQAGEVLGAVSFTPVWSDNKDGRAHVLLGPAPDYANTLAAEYTTDGGATIRALAKPDYGDPENLSLPATVWVTNQLGAGTHDVRARFVVDGTAQAWSGTRRVSVSEQNLATQRVIDPFGDGRLTFTLDAEYPVGQFADGEWYVVAPEGVVIAESFPATAGSGSNIRNGLSVDVELGRQGLDSRGHYFQRTAVYDHAATIKPGSVAVKAISYNGSNNHIQHLATLTILNQRPPADSFRPAVHKSATRELRNYAEIDLSRVPRIQFDNGGFPSVATIQNQLNTYLKRPAPPLGSGSGGARHMYPGGQAYTYHQNQRAMYAWPAWIIMADNLEDEALRKEMVVSMVQRAIDIFGAHESRQVSGAGPFYHWVAPMTFAGTLLREPLMRGADVLGIASGDYNFDGAGRMWQYMAWEDYEAFAALSESERNSYGARDRHRDLNKPGSFTDLNETPGTEVWEDILVPRTVTWVPDTEQAAQYIRDLGITDTGDGTWTIPANRFSDGGRYAWAGTAGVWGETRLLPGPDLFSVSKTGAAWGDEANNHPKLETYVAQHSGQAAALAPLLKAVAGEDYLARGKSKFGKVSAWELYSGYALQWMRTDPDWLKALGFHDRQPGSCGAGGGCAHFWQRVNLGRFPAGFVANGYVERWEEIQPTINPTTPEPATRQMFDLVRGSGIFTFVLKDLPHDGWARIEGVEISIDGGPWVNTNTRKPGDTYAHTLSGSAPEVAMRVVNSHGAGPASGEKTVPSADSRDSDLDGMIDAEDNCVLTPNRPQIDSDYDGIGDACDNTPNPVTIPDDGVIILDTFTDVDDSLNGHFPDRSAFFDTWSNVDFAIDGLKDFMPAIRGNRVVGTPPGGVQDGKIEADFSDGTLTVDHGPASNRHGIIFRLVNDNNFWYAGMYREGAVVLKKVVDGTIEVVQADQGSTAAGTITATLDGDNITVEIGGVTLNVDDATHNTGSQYGLFVRGDTWFDNFQFSIPTEAAESDQEPVDDTPAPQPEPPEAPEPPKAPAEPVRTRAPVGEQGNEARGRSYEHRNIKERTAENVRTNRLMRLKVRNAVSCDVSEFVSKRESDWKTDTTRRYPLGLFAMTLECVDPGETVQQEIVLDDRYDTSDWELRKYNRTSETYTTIDPSRYTFAEEDGVTVIRYSLTDGGDLDEDGLENGVIVDPVGPAVIEETENDESDNTEDSSAEVYSSSGNTQKTNLVDNCPGVTNPDQTDSDGDGIGDACDPDETMTATTPTESTRNPNRVQSTHVLNVRSTPAGELRGTQSVGALGTKAATAPVFRAGYDWIFVDFDTDPDGYVATEFLTAPNPQDTLRQRLLVLLRQLLRLYLLQLEVLRGS